MFGLIAKMAFSVRQKKNKRARNEKKKKKIIKRIQMTNNKRIAGDGKSQSQSQSQYQSITSFPEIKSPLCYLHFHKFYVFRLFFFLTFCFDLYFISIYFESSRLFAVFFSFALSIIEHFLCDLKIGHYVIAAVDLSHIMFNV